MTQTTVIFRVANLPVVFPLSLGAHARLRRADSDQNRTTFSVAAASEQAAAVVILEHARSVYVCRCMCRLNRPNMLVVGPVASGSPNITSYVTPPTGDSPVTRPQAARESRDQRVDHGIRGREEA